MHSFVAHPRRADYLALAAWLETASAANLHPTLWPQRLHVAECLRRMALCADDAEPARAYHALRLFVWT